MEPGLTEYDRLLGPARQHFAANWEANGLLAPDIEPALLELFLIHFCATGYRMTEPVESWIRRAAARCAEIGLHDAAKALQSHAKAESGHHLMMMRDLNALIERWNSERTPCLVADDVLRRPLGPGATCYCKVHEDNISSATPFAQFAIEYEIEQLPVQYGPPFLGWCVDRLGKNILNCMSFVTEHVELDVGHTKFNARELDKIIDGDRSRLPVLAAAGSDALTAYGHFLADCMANAKQQRGLAACSP